MLTLLNVVHRVNSKVSGSDLLIHIFFYKSVSNSYYPRELDAQLQINVKNQNVKNEICQKFRNSSKNISYTYVHFTKQSLDNLKLIVSSMNNLKWGVIVKCIST